MAQQPASGAEPDNSEGRLEEVRSLRGWRAPGSLLCLPLTCILIHIQACIVGSIMLRELLKTNTTPNVLRVTETFGTCGDILSIITSS